MILNGQGSTTWIWVKLEHTQNWSCVATGMAAHLWSCKVMVGGTQTGSMMKPACRAPGRHNVAGDLEMLLTKREGGVEPRHILRFTCGRTYRTHYIYTDIYRYLYIYSTYTHRYVHRYIHVHIQICIRELCIYMCVYIHTYIYISLYIYIQYIKYNMCTYARACIPFHMFLSCASGWEDLGRFGSRKAHKYSQKRTRYIYIYTYYLYNYIYN